MMNPNKIIPKEESEESALEMWLYCQIDSLQNTRNIVEKGMYTAYCNVLDKIEEIRKVKSMDREQTKQAILGFAEFFKGITGNQNLKIPSDIAEKYGIEVQTEEEQERQITE